jgi:putative transposase
MRGFGIFASAARFCRAFDEVRQFFRVRIIMEQKVSLAQKREAFHQQLDALKTLVPVAGLLVEMSSPLHKPEDG